VSRITVSAKFRLSESQMSIVWQGLDRIIKSYVAHRTKGGLRYEYPFQIYPPPVGFSRGKFDRNFMDEIVGLWKRLRPKAKTGGRVQMDAVELRASIFSIRANLDYVRSRRYFYRRLKSEQKAAIRLDDGSFEQLNIKSQRVIHTLERHAKRANRSLLKSVPRDAYDSVMDAWRLHLRWMRLHIAYFKPLTIRGRVRGSKGKQQKMLEELTQMAKVAIENEGFEQPDSSELWCILRLYARSARRGREGIHGVHYMVRNIHLAEPRVYLLDFIHKRLKLKELSAS
jgi:hypothetical protein